jgi:hypothetical protein
MKRKKERKLSNTLPTITITILDELNTNFVHAFSSEWISHLDWNLNTNLEIYLYSIQTIGFEEGQG